MDNIPKAIYGLGVTAVVTFAVIAIITALFK